MTATAIRELIRPVETSASNVWEMVAHRHLCLGPSGAKHQSGGSTLASVITVMEAVTQRPLVYASAQFFGSPPAGNLFQIELRKRTDGRSISQVVAVIIAEGQELAYVTASLGRRSEPTNFTWEKCPDVPQPELCRRVPFVREEVGDLHSHLDMRLALDPRSDPKGKALFWVATETDLPVTSSFLAQIADYLPEAIHMNVGRAVGAISLDNVVRVISRPTTPWLLCDIQVNSVSNGIFTGRMTVFSQGGEIIACASQSGVIREL
jgi:acyl-CoA thioesterase II